jgi:hypothetical protein
MTKIVEEDLVFYASTNGLGGAVTATVIPKAELHNTFQVLDADTALIGATEYMCVYLKNTNVTNTLTDTAIYLTDNTPSLDTNAFIGLGSSGVGATEQTIADINTAPIGIAFTETLSDALQIGGIPPNSWFAIWLKRVNLPDTGAVQIDGFSMSVQGKTAG